MAAAHYWVVRVMVVSLQMALPALLGGWVDAWLGCAPWLMLLGIACGLVFGVWRLTSMTGPPKTPQGKGR